ncbi:MAG: hypothetical protein VKM98_02615, partial [Cyanobacteriota bacterium]|nr:hypothetical protein [Cyanobacteriota bacterium]
MSSSTLIVSLDGLSVSQFQDVVQARGIERVIVVGSQGGFSSVDFAGTSAGASAVKTLTNNGISVELALASGTSLSLSNAGFTALSTNGLTFLNDPGLQSLSTALVASNGQLALGSSAVLQQFNSANLAANVLDGGLALSTGFGSQPSVTITGRPATAPISDLGGTIKVNLTATEFATLLATTGGLAEVEKTANLVVAPVTPAPARVFARWENAGNYYDLRPSEVPAFNGQNQLGNLTTVPQTQTTVGSTASNYFWFSNGSLTASQALALPRMGVAPHGSAIYGGSVRLIDTATNLSLVLPQLTSGQLASFNAIVVSDDQPLRLDAATLKRLDTATQVATWSNQRGTAVLTSTDAAASLELVASTFAELQTEGLLVNGLLVAQVSGNAGPNLMAQVKSLDVAINNASDLTIANSLVSQGIKIDIPFFGGAVTASEFELLAKSGNKFQNGVSLLDTPANIKGILLSDDPDVVAARSKIDGLSSTNSPAAIELTWQQYQTIIGERFPTFPVTNLFSNLGNIELVVSGTATELQALFEKFGTDFSGLDAGVSFRVTDGGEVTVNAAQLDKLDGRLYGAALVVDTSEGIAGMLEKAIPTTVKDIVVSDGDANTTDQLVLTVAQFRNLPGYAADQVIISDSEINIIRALSYGNLDDRVVGLRITAEATGVIDGGLTLNAATAPKLGDLSVELQTGAGYVPAPLVIRDRGSAIANFIETASLPQAISSVLFVESMGRDVSLNDEQLAAWNSLSYYITVLSSWSINEGEPVQGAVFVPAPNSGVDLTALTDYLNQRLDDLATAITAGDTTLATNTAAAVTALTAVQADLKAAIAAGDAATQAALTQAVTDLSAAITAGDNALAADIAAAVTALGVAQTALTAAIAAGDAATQAALTQAVTDLTNAITAGDTALAADIKGYLNQRLVDFSTALDSTNPLAQWDAYKRALASLEQDIQQAGDAAWAAKQSDAVAAATAVADSKVKPLEDAAWAAKQTERATAQEQAVDAARIAFQESEWAAVEPGLAAARTAAQDQAVADARTAFQTSEWAAKEPGLAAARTAAQDQAVADARIAFQDSEWAAKEPGLAAARTAAQDQAVAVARTNTAEPIAYFDVLPETVAAGATFTATILVSAIDPSAAGEASTTDIALNLSAGLTLLSAASGGLFGTTVLPAVVLGSRISYDNFNDAQLGVTGSLITLQIRNDSPQSVNPSGLIGIQSITVGEIFAINPLNEQSIRTAAALAFDADPLNTEDGIKQAAGATFDANSANITSIRDAAGAAFDAVPGNSEAEVRADVRAEQNYTTLYDDALADFYALPGNDEASVRAEAAADIAPVAPKSLFERLIAAISSNGSGTANLSEELIGIINSIKQTVDKLDAEFITVAEFDAIKASGIPTGASYQISDTAANIAGLLEQEVDESIVALVPSNGAKLQLDAEQIQHLYSAKDYRLYSGFIDLSASLKELTDIDPLALRLATSYVLTDAAISGSTFENL